MSTSMGREPDEYQLRQKALLAITEASEAVAHLSTCLRTVGAPSPAKAGSIACGLERAAARVRGEDYQPVLEADRQLAREASRLFALAAAAIANIDLVCEAQAIPPLALVDLRALVGQFARRKE